MSEMTSSVGEQRSATSKGLRRRAESEYLEMPGLKLTAAQAARLWHLNAEASAALLDSMVEAGVLYRTRDGSYLLLSSSAESLRPLTARPQSPVSSCGCAACWGAGPG